MRYMVLFTLVIGSIFGLSAAFYITYMNRLRARETERARLARGESPDGAVDAPRRG